MQQTNIQHDAESLNEQFDRYHTNYIAAIFSRDDIAADFWREKKLQTMANMLRVVVREYSPDDDTESDLED